MPAWAAPTALLLLLCAGLLFPLGCSLEREVERLAGFDPQHSVAVEQAAGLIHRGEYSLAMLRLGAETKDVSPPRQARILGAYALLIAGDSIGAFAQSPRSRT